MPEPESDTVDIEALGEKLAGFDKAKMPFPKAWYLSDYRHEEPESWERIQPANWVNLLDIVSKHRNDKGETDGILNSLHDFAHELEGLQKTNPALWQAFVINYGEFVLYLNKKDGERELGGACRKPDAVIYKGMIPFEDKYKSNTLVHELGHALDHMMMYLSKADELYREELFSHSPLFQEAFLLDLHATPQHPVTERIMTLIPSGGIEETIPDIDGARRYAEKVRKGGRAPGDTVIFRTPEEEDNAFRRANRSVRIELIFQDILKGEIKLKKQKRFPACDTREVRKDKRITMLAEKEMGLRQLDVKSTWLEAFARTMETYFGFSTQEAQSLPYPALTCFMQRFIPPTLEVLSQDDFIENAKAQLSRIDSYINRPLKDMMEPQDYKHYLRLREMMDDAPERNRIGAVEENFKAAQAILIRTIERVARKLETEKRHHHQPSLLR